MTNDERMPGDNARKMLVDAVDRSVAGNLLGFGARASDFGLWTCLLAFLLVAAARGSSGEPSRKTAGQIQAVELRGRVVCLAEEMQRRHQAELPTRHEHLWGFRAEDGKFYTLLRSKYSEAIFRDERVRQKELQVKARLFPDTQILELTNIRSVKHGVAQDLYYYCEVCAIKAVSPEPCACCQGPVVLVEKPLSDHSE